MTDKLAILIPSRNEPHLTKTVDDCFAKLRGNTEVVVHLDGYWPLDWKEVTARHPDLHTIHSGEPCGMRPGINKAAGTAISRGAKWLMKLDAHCMLDEGFDVKLLADIEPNWIVIPRRKRLDPETWTLQDVGKPDIDYHYLSFPDDPQDFGGPGLNGKVWTQRIIERKDKPEYDIDDEMSSQGSAWLCSADYFQQLELMDAKTWGPFWSEAQEVMNKAWLSGGRCVVNKKTWYAHWHKGKQGRGYRLEESWLKQGRDAAMKWLYNDAWAKQTLPFKSLIERFWPVPTWPEDWEERVYGSVGKGGDSFLRGSDTVRDVHAGNDSGADAVSLKIVSATYGVGEDFLDVTERVRALMKDDSLDIVVNNSTLTPGQNPYRGKKKSLVVVYAYDGSEHIRVERDEKDWLIIGPAMHVVDGVLNPAPLEIGSEEVARLVSKRDGREDDVRPVVVLNHTTSESGHRVVDKVIELGPIRTAAALNDYLIRKFQISPQRLRGPMPIELRDFHRNDLAQLFAELGFKRGAEIGVAEGNYSEVLLKANPTCELLLVDPWHAYSDNPQNKSKEKHTYAFNEMMRKTDGYEGRRVQMMSSMKAVASVEESSLDFCYIDGNHLFDYVMQDLIEWSKRVRSGGLVSGDDYYALDQKRWTGGGVVEAVQAYTNAHRIPLWFTFQGHKSVDFAWVKP